MCRVSSSHILFLAAFVAQAGFSHGYSSDDGGISVSGDVLSGNWPYDISNDTLTELLSRPNTTGAVDFTLQRNSFSLNVSVLADVPVKDEVTQMSVLSLETSADELNSSFDDGLTLCAVVFYGLSTNATAYTVDKNEGQNCAALPSECVTELQGAVTDQVVKTGNCSAAVMPSSCENAFIGSNQATAFSISRENLKNKYIEAYGSELKPAGNDSAYNIAGTNVWPVMLVSHYRGRNLRVTGMQCVHADTVSKGSKTPVVPGDKQDNGDGSGDGQNDDGQDYDDAAPKITFSHVFLLAAGAILAGLL